MKQILYVKKNIIPGAMITNEITKIMEKSIQKKQSGVLPTILRKCVLADFTPALQKPPKSGEDGGKRSTDTCFQRRKF